MNLISMDKKYRRRGGTKPVRVFCVDADNFSMSPVIYLDESNIVVRTTSHGKYTSGSEPHSHDLVEYIEPKMVPLGPEDILVSFKFRRKTWTDKNAWKFPVCGGSNGLRFIFEHSDPEGCRASYKELQDDWLINRNDGKGWVACEKPAQE